jgi:cytidylate kinase
MHTVVRTVAISRQRGSGGTFVGREVADRLGLRFVDREMLRVAAEYLRDHDSPAGSEQADSSWWSRISQAFALGGPDSRCAPPSVESVYDGDLFKIEERLLREIVDDDATVVVGRGAAQTLRGRTGVLSVFLHAPEPWRINRIQNVYRLADRRAAQQMVHESDRARARFIQTLGEVGWTDVRGYDLALDTAAVTVEEAVNLIVEAARAGVATASAGTASAG